LRRRNFAATPARYRSADDMESPMRLTARHPLKMLAIGVLALLLGAAPLSALAQEAIATAAHGPDGGAPMAPPSDRLLSLDDDNRDDGPGFLRPRGPCGGPAKTADGKTDKTPHGEVYAGIGTHGYREAGGAVCVPVGDHAAVSIAIDAGRMDGWRGRRR
jgi:hypothetical protein